MTRAAIILCGGKSSRMGLPKATLPFGPECMLQRVVRITGAAVQEIVLVAAQEQRLPPLNSAVALSIVHDRREGRGPLEGLAAGLSSLSPNAAAAFVTSCDVPLLQPAFLERMFALLGDAAIAVPVDPEGFAHPLAAVYRPQVLAAVHALLAADRLRPAFLFEQVPTRRVPVELLREVDPTLASLRNLNRPEDYLAALSAAGFAAPADVIERLRTGAHEGSP